VKARARERETVGSSSGRPEGARDEGWRRRCTSSREGDRRRQGRPAGCGSDASGWPALAREGGRREGIGARDGGGRLGRAGESSSSSTAGLPLVGEELSFDFRSRDLSCEESKR
jgi:hypothetical protein